MILLSNQISNLKYDNYLTNQKKSINMILKDTVVGTAVKVATWTKSFSMPSAVNAYKKYLTGGLYSGRTEVGRFTISENNVFTFSNPTNYSYMEITYTTRHREAWQAYGSENRLNTKYDTYSPLYIYNATRINNLPTTTKSEESLETAPAKNSTSYNGSAVSIPTGNLSTITVRQNGLYSFTLEGTQPYYTAFGSNKTGAYSSSNEEPYTFWQIEDYLMENIKIDMFAQTVVSNDVNFSSSDAKPSLEIPSNELLQYNAKHGTDPLNDYMADQIVSRNASGRLIISFALLDESATIAEGDLIQVKDKFGNFIRNGAYFKVYKLQYAIDAQLRRDITAVEVTV